MSEYGFPMLSPDECVSFFREVSNTAISEEDFKKPDARRWQIFYGTMFELMTGRQADPTAQTRLHSFADCEYSDLHEESFALMTFTLMLRRVMSAAGVRDFTVRDMIEPRPKRLQRIVSGAINFIRFRFFHDEVFNKKKEELERKRESYDFVLKENAELKKTLQSKQAAHESHMLKMTKLQEENDAIALRIQDQHKQRDGVQRNLSEMKNDLAQKNAANDQLKVNILSGKAEGEKLSLRIIQSPERLKAEQDRAGNRILELRATVEDKHSRLDEVQRRSEGTLTLQKSVDKAVRMLKDMNGPNDKMGEVEKEIQGLQDAYQDLHGSWAELSARVESLMQQDSLRKDKLAKMDLQYRNKKDSMKENIAELAQLKETLRDPQGSSESRKSDLMMEKERVDKDMERRTKEHEKKLEHVNTLYSEILQQVDRRNIEVANGFQKFKSVMKSVQDP